MKQVAVQSKRTRRASHDRRHRQVVGRFGRRLTTATAATATAATAATAAATRAGGKRRGAHCHYQPDRMF